MSNGLEAFEQVEMRVGRIVRAEVNERARRPSYKLWIDFGPLGERTSSAQLTERYAVDDLKDQLIIAAVNLGGRNIAGFVSQVLVLGVPDEHNRTVLLQPQRDVPPGGRVH